MKSVRVEIAKTALMHAMRHVIKAVVAHPSLPILLGVHIQADANGITFTASNTRMTMQFGVPRDHADVTVTRTGAAVVSAHYFYNMLRKLDPGAVTLEMTEPLVLTIVSVSTRMRLCGMDVAEFPDVDPDKPVLLHQLRIHNGRFRSAVKQVAAVASTSENRPVLTGVFLEYDRGALQLTATDGIRLASRTLPVESSETSGFNAIIPAKDLYEISKMLGREDEITEIGISHNRVRFMADTLKIESVRIQGSFPSAKSVIPESFLCEMVIAKAGLLRAVERVTIMAGEHRIRLETASEQLKLSSETSGVGEVENEVPLLAITGEAFVLSLNGKLFVDILRNLDCTHIRIKYAGTRRPLSITPEDSLESILFLITAIRTPETFSTQQTKIHG